MKLVFIYGPPASGKTTVGREIARRTGFSFFFNHVTVPAARAVFPRRHDPKYELAYSDLLKELQYAGIKAAVLTDVNIIFTLAYSGTVDDVFVESVVDLVESHGGTVQFVQVHAPYEVLFERVSHPDREMLGKVTDAHHLQDLLQTRDLRAAVRYDTVLHIDTGSISPVDAAERAINHFALT